MYDIFNNPLWWVIPVVLLISFLVNHKVELPGHKKGDDANTPSKKDNDATPPPEGQ